jgi:RNA polymerase sigma factor (sigma-70 family)
MPADDTRPAGAAAGLPDRRAHIADLVAAARNGNEGAFGQIVTELSPMLWHVARAVGLDVEDAEDVLQTAWTRLLASLHTIHDSTALIGWLVVTTRREAWRVHAAARKQLPTDQEWLSELPDHGPGSEELIMMDDERRALWEAIGKLSRRCQELLRIVAFVPRPDYQELAAELGMPTGSIGPTRGRCLAKLRTLLAGRP